jgi:hypothetical protein
MVTGRSPQKWRFLRLENGNIKAQFMFRYNPSTNEENYTPNWSFERSPGNVLPWAIFNGLDEANISTTVFLDATETYDPALRGVDAYLDFFRGLTLPDSAKYLAGMRNYAAPPEMLLVIGEQIMPVVVTSLNIRILRRNSVLHPTRAEVDISMTRYLQSAENVDNWMREINSSRYDVEIDWIG